MTAKAPKVTLKSLQNEMRIIKEELETFKDEANSVKKELAEVKDELMKIKDKEQLNVFESRILNDELKCNSCANEFNSQKDLKLHVKEKHPRKIKCKLCEELFNKNSELEMHIEICHVSTERYKCEKCNKTFVLKWRLTKHQENHTGINKKCHYFNNKKVCPYEEIGCMFDHSLSEICIFGKSCLNKLCPFQHNRKDLGIEVVEADEKELKDKFDNLTDDEQYESKMVLCDKLCKASHGYHRCNNKDYEGYVGCDIFNITDEFDDDCRKTELFPCEECDEIFEEYDKVRQHFLKEHARYERIGCIENNCKITFKTVDILVMHIGIEHYEKVKQRL